ncbi:uncharacterized protein J8A68_005471 [[Candida] subhashii]|uniref:SYO1-like TPR repeats domain-containing protein n=1 Tax=[Candida] subhashii TaxID=561895 RepID=A0A8J5Q636_9ASCO|nr:uncharacterized protein J8A68_005471 [[Candida] subhashii]KAG7660951.1 hypothetical protein J8A68_005471 [[Candida] subhashii]
MGKLRKSKKNQKARLNPIGSSKKNNTDTSKRDENTIQSKIVPLINKLKSTIPNEKSMAIGAITVLAEDERMRKLLLKEKLITIVMEQCLNDSNDEIVVESFGLLRNLGIEEGYDVLKYLWRSNIWITIENGLNKVDTSFKYLQEHPDKQDKSKVQLLYDFTENLLSLIIVLASGSQDIYESIFNKIDPIIGFVVNLINLQISNESKFKISTKLFNSLLEFIYEFSTESIDFIKKLNENSNLDFVKLIEYVESNQSNKLANIYIEGIKFNNYEILETNHQDKDQIAQSIFIRLYNLIIDIDLNELKQKINSISNPDNSNKPIQKDANTLEKDLSSSSIETKSQTKAELYSLEISLDIITSILEYLSINEESPQDPIELSPELQTILLDKTFMALIELLKFEINENILQLIEKILSALNNLTWLMLSNETLPVEWYTKSLSLWDIILTLSSKQDQSPVVQNSCLNILWGVVKSLGPEIVSEIQPEMIGGLITKAKNILGETESNTTDDDSLNMYLSIVGFLGTLAPIVGNNDITNEISQFLLQSCQECINKSEQNPIIIEIIIESLNLIYEIFSDKDFSYDYEIFVKQNYLSNLKNLQPNVKQVYKKIDKHKQPQLKLKMEETWINLGRFIQYKETERI